MRDKLLSIELLKEAMKSGDKMRVSVIKNLKSEISRAEGGRKQLSEAEIVSMIKKSIDNIKELIKNFKSTGGSESEIELLNEELSILESFLPEQMSESEIEVAVDELLKETGVTEIKQMGRVMGMFSKKYAGKADNGIASKIIKSKLQ